MTTPTLPPEIAAALEEAPWIINGMIDAPHPMYRYQVVLKDDPTCFGEPCSYNQARAEANRLNTLHRNQRVATLIAEREKALVEALKAAARNLWNSGTAYSCQGTLTAAKEADAALKKAEAR